MDPFITAAIASGLTSALTWLAAKLVEKEVEIGSERGLGALRDWLYQKQDRKKAEKALQDVFSKALKSAGAPVEDDKKALAWMKQVGLDKLSSEKMDPLRRQVGRAILGYTDPGAEPPEEIVRALGWPQSRLTELSKLLSTLRHELMLLPEWRPLFDYANQMESLSLLGQVLQRLARLDEVMVLSESGQALRVVIEQRHLDPQEAALIEESYRQDLVRKLTWHDFRGISQFKKNVLLPLADIYLELGLLEAQTDEERQALREKLMEISQEKRLEMEEMRSTQRRVSDALGQHPRLIILGDPGAGKTISLNFIALMLAHGYGAARLGLEAPFFPIQARLADFASELEKRPALSLETYLLEALDQAFRAGNPRLPELLGLALEKGKCLLLLDGLDELASELQRGRSMRGRVLQAVQNFANTWCRDRSNRLVVTSRIEGYWREPLAGFIHVELSPLRLPKDVEEFLLRWFSAYEHELHPDLPNPVIKTNAQKKVGSLLPQILSSPSASRLATNPLLLTILVLIHENVGRLPNRRIKLYEAAAQTIIESWRQAQAGLLNDLPELDESDIMNIMSPLAYWLHENNPGGTASIEEWQNQLEKILKDMEYANASGLAGKFLDHARFFTGVLCERGQGKFGFFHLTFEEYLAARELARQPVGKRFEMLDKHWADPRWQEVILLAAGQLGIIESRPETGDFLTHLLAMQPQTTSENGRPALLAGRALADIGQKVGSEPRRWIKESLRCAMQDLDADSGKPCQPGRVPLRTRAAAADVLDELGWLPENLSEFVRIPAAPQPFWIAKYPVTNAQYERFLKADDFADPQLWLDFAQFDERSQPMKKNWGRQGWDWLESAQQNPDRSPDGKVVLPRYWSNPEFGIQRRGVPVVGVTWWEASAYCRWLARHWIEREEAQANPDLRLEALRLPTEREWILAAGGDSPKERFPWDLPGQVTHEIGEILRRANISESKIGHTTPVGMYPLGASPLGVRDLSGNAFEWQASFYDKNHNWPCFRGGSWGFDVAWARLAVRDLDHPVSRWSSHVGFRVGVFPI